MNTHKWDPIADLPADWRTSLREPSTSALVDAWLEQAEELRGKDLYRRFVEKLRRKWAIETGVIEGIYSITEGATVVLIEKGLEAAFLSHQDTDRSAVEVIAKIRDQERAIQGLYDFVAGNRPFGTSYIKELHQVLTTNQPTYEARDSLGNFVTRELPRGEWKALPNNVEHGDGARFEYCPPEHVAAEMDRLISMHFAHEEAGVPADIEAAWLHHRFTLIHPFTDGNGRIARCLATLVFLKARWLPLVVTRHDREKYIAALRAADEGDLKLLVQLFGELQRKAIRQALSLGEDVMLESHAIHGVLQNIRLRFARESVGVNSLRTTAISTAAALYEIAKERLSQVAYDLNQSIGAAGSGFYAKRIFGDPETPKAKFNYIQIVSCAKKMGYFADLGRFQAWAGIAIETLQHSEILFSFHGIGREHAGVLGVSGMVYSKSVHGDGSRLVDEVVPLGDEPFEFPYSENNETVIERFRRWLDSRIVEALHWWQQQL